jgi:hypothetical protein
MAGLLSFADVLAGHAASVRPVRVGAVARRSVVVRAEGDAKKQAPPKKKDEKPQVGPKKNAVVRFKNTCPASDTGYRSGVCQITHLVTACEANTTCALSCTPVMHMLRSLAPNRASRCLILALVQLRSQGQHPLGCTAKGRADRPHGRGLALDQPTCATQPVVLQLTWRLLLLKGAAIAATGGVWHMATADSSMSARPFL